MSYFYGPVPSRRLGFSLGIDLLPKKVCSFDCIYCHVGVTTKKSIRRFSRVDLAEFKKELTSILCRRPRIDYITFSGSGEPTLHKDLGKIMRAVKDVTKKRYPLCVLTNSSLLWRRDVRAELKEADLIVPSLDAANARDFHKINQPVKGVTFRKVVEGLIALRKEFQGKIWLEIMLLAGINDSSKDARDFRKIIDKIKPDKLQINLPVRPAPVKLKLPTKAKLNNFVKIIGVDNIEITGSFRRNDQRKFSADIKEEIMKYLRRRPATLDDLSRSLGIERKHLAGDLKTLIRNNEIKEKIAHKKAYYILCGE